MKSITLLSVAIFFFFYHGAAQVTPGVKPPMDPPVDPGVRDSVFQPVDANFVFRKVDKLAEFPGGVEGWKNYIRHNLDGNVPVKNKAPEGSYTVVIKFIVSKEGDISDFASETNNGYGMEEELIRIIKKGPKWFPGTINGRNVNSYRYQHVTFVVEKQ